MREVMTLNNVKAAAVHFKSPFNDGNFLVVLPKEVDWIDFLDRYNPQTHKQAVGLNFDSDDEHFFLVYCDDCFDPPLAVVRASTYGDAEEVFVDELNWAHVDTDTTNAILEEAHADPSKKQRDSGEFHSEDHIRFNSYGKAYDSESIQVYGVKMCKVELE